MTTLFAWLALAIAVEILVWRHDGRHAREVSGRTSFGDRLRARLVRALARLFS